MRFGPIVRANGRVVHVDAIGGAPSLAAIEAVLTPPAAPAPTPAEKMAAALGVSVADLKSVLTGIETTSSDTASGDTASG